MAARLSRRIALAALLALALALPLRAPVGRPPGHARAELARALEQGGGPGHARRVPPTALLPGAALLEALDDPALLAADRGEREALEAEARWLVGLRPGDDLGGRSWEDVRFLLGFFRWYLARAAGEDAPPASCDPEALRAFRGAEYLDLLGAMD